jgi:hypothetical protein
MPAFVEFVVECPVCGHEASSGITMLTDVEEGRPIKIDLDLLASQVEFSCGDPACQKTCYSSDYEVSV